LPAFEGRPAFHGRAAIPAVEGREAREAVPGIAAIDCVYDYSKPAIKWKSGHEAFEFEDEEFDEMLEFFLM